MLIRIDAIRENGNLRHVKAPAASDAALEASIRVQGVLQPVLVRPDGAGYVLIAGHRRLRCARAAGLEEIPAEIQTMTEGWALAAQAAENMVRVAMHPVDQWRAVRDLVAGGLGFPDAAAALGLDDRQTRRMERLGMLDPKLLELIEASGALPSDWQLRIIANAPRAMQAKAIKGKGALQDWDGEKRPMWHVIAHACQINQYFRAHAIFAADAMTWDVDFFAQPGADDEYTTTDGETFMRLQREALASQVQDAHAKKKRILLVEADASGAWPKMPSGFSRSWSGNPEKPKRNECVFVTLVDTGEVRRIVGLDQKAAKAAEAKKTARATGGKAPDDEADDDPDTDAPEPVVVLAEKPGLTKAGLTMVADAKTQALRESLRRGLVFTPPEQMLALMTLAWGALNVSVHNPEEPERGGYNPDLRHFGDLAGRILLPGGGLDNVSMSEARGLAGEVMARVLSFGVAGAQGFYHGSSGKAAEWIGAAIGADQALPRFDTAEFLQQVGSDELRRAATAVGEKSTGTVKALRERLVGKMPDWRPDAAAFGAPAPILGTAARPADDTKDAA